MVVNIPEEMMKRAEEKIGGEWKHQWSVVIIPATDIARTPAMVHYCKMCKLYVTQLIEIPFRTGITEMGVAILPEYGCVAPPI